MALNFKGNKEQEATAKPEVAEVEAKEKEVAQAPAQTGNENWGVARGDLAFVCPLGDPSQPDTTRVKLPDGTIDKKVTPTIVGYKFKLLKDMRIPAFGTNDGLKRDPMNFENLDKFEDHKAGDIVALTPFETAYLLSQPQFNGGCDGGEKGVVCVYQFKGLKGKNGQVETLSQASATPRVSLKATEGSIKDFQIEEVLSFTTEDVNGQKRKNRTIKPGFEKWAPLAKSGIRKASGKSATGGKEDPTKVANKNAQAFMAFVNRKRSNA